VLGGAFGLREYGFAIGIKIQVPRVQANNSQIISTPLLATNVEQSVSSLSL
jgi:hypothetical protein